ncbi:MAG: hypothetical protein HC853_07965 [Anaerolineae bacterium]|nr:hypothetical protein [Anaerolineae bacterium]
MGDYMLVPRMLISVVLMTVIQILFHLFNYATSDPQALWLMFLVPLIVTSRNGSTQDWRIVMGAVILGNFAIGYWSDGFAGQTFWDTIVRSICIGLFAGAIHIITRKARYNEELLSVGGEIARLLANQPSFEAAYQEAARQIQRLQNPSDSYVFIHLWREETQRLSLVGIAGKPSATPIQLDLRKGEGVTGRVLETGIPTIVRNRCDA